ncbi:hypothetical protein Tco_0346849, partial [Tanacetum coccineum]
MCLVWECWIGLHEMAMAAFESQYIDKDTYSASAEDLVRNTQIKTHTRLLLKTL